MNITDLVKNGKMARITHFFDGNLWYETEDGFKFPVPVSNVSEVGNATFMAEEKALLLMRYIRKHLALVQQ